MHDRGYIDKILLNIYRGREIKMTLGGRRSSLSTSVEAPPLRPGRARACRGTPSLHRENKRPLLMHMAHMGMCLKEMRVKFCSAGVWICDKRLHATPLTQSRFGPTYIYNISLIIVSYTGLLRHKQREKQGPVTAVDPSSATLTQPQPPHSYY